MPRQIVLHAAGFLLACLFVPGLVREAGAHPHAFVDATVEVVCDAEGLAGFRQSWLLDAMTTVAVLDTIGENHDGVLDPGEEAAIAQLNRENLATYGYFTVLSVNGEPRPLEPVEEFSARLDGGRLVYSFFTPCRVAAGGGFQKARMAVFDPTFYVYVNYVRQGERGPDPMADPLFADTSAPARPGDYKRFAEAVGVDGYSGPVPVAGAGSGVECAAVVEDAPDMAYFHGQIVPQVFAVRFRRR